MILRALLAIAFVSAATSGAAFDLTLPGSAQQLADRDSPLDSYDLPVGGYADGEVPVRRFEGDIQRETWRVGGSSITSLQILAPLRDQVTAQGYETLFECEDRTCGGFDFRFATEVVPAPDMHVDIRDYRFLSAVKGDWDALSLLVRRSRTAAYIQVITVSGSEETNTVGTDGNTGSGPADAAADQIVKTLQANGHVILRDLEFQTGADTLGRGPFASLEQLAVFLRATPEQRIALVGHTDSTGALKTNISLSKRRAGSVRDRLVTAYDVDPGQIEAEGMGYLAPIASNLTQAGREANRRVEAILLTAK